MAASSCVVFLVFTGLVWMSSSSPTITTTTDVSLVARPISFYPGLTRHLEVSCSHHIHNGSDFSTVVSLILSKNSISQQNQFTEIASVTSQDPDSVQVKNNSLTDDVTGGLPQAGMAFITMKLTNPSKDAAGEYKCQAFGIDHGGHPRVSTDETEVVVEESITTAVLLDKIMEMDKSQEDLKKELEDYKANVSKQFNNLMATTMDASDTYNGHTYYLSKPMLQNIAISESLCRSFGGYLVELDDKQEYDFVYDFVITRNHGGQVTVGATDQGHEGVWKFMYSGNPITYTNWWDGMNGGDTSNCMELWHGHVGMCTEPCVTDHIERFACEVPHLGTL